MWEIFLIVLEGKEAFVKSFSEPFRSAREQKQRSLQGFEELTEIKGLHEMSFAQRSASLHIRRAVVESLSGKLSSLFLVSSHFIYVSPKALAYVFERH